MQIAAALSCLFLLAGAANAQTCRVNCPDGSSFVVDCDTNNDPCGSAGGESKDPYVPSDDGAARRAAEQAAIEAERSERERQRQQLESEKRAHKDAFDRAHDNSLGSLKGSGGNEDGLRGLAEEARHEDLRDAGPTGTGSTPAKPKRKVKPTPAPRPWLRPRLRPVADPLHKDPLPGDSTGFLAKYADWAAAGACNGTAALDGGKVVCCPKGFPYYCNGRCYREAAFDDFRIPCDHALLTTEQRR